MYIVKKDKDHVWIDGIMGFNPTQWAASPHGAIARVLKAVDYPMTYEDLVGYTGFIFRINVEKDLCPSSAHPASGYQTLHNIGPVLPYHIKRFESIPGQPMKNRKIFEAEANRAIKESIDRGIPVPYGSEEDGFIFGYTDNGKRWFCYHPYHKWGSEPYWYDEAENDFTGKKWPWGIAVYDKPKSTEERVPEKELLISTLNQVVEMWHTEFVDNYYCGKSAYDHWIKWLQSIDSGEKSQPAAVQGNGWILDVLIQNRRIAAEWLPNKSSLLGKEAAIKVNNAAVYFGQLIQTLLDGLTNSYELTLSPQKVDEWTPELRQIQIVKLEKARELDQKAVETIKEALDIIGR